MLRSPAPVALLFALLFSASLTSCDSDKLSTPEEPPSEEEDTTPPNAPSSLEGLSQNGAVALEWNAPSADDLSGYRVYRSQSSFSDPGSAEQVSGESPMSGTSYTDDSAENGTTYHYRVAAVDEAGNAGNLSNAVEKTPFPDPPDKP